MRAKNATVQFWLFIALMAGFMVKVPIWPFHTWLPAAYGEAPTGVVVLLAAVMAKLGTFGILRLVLPLVPDAALAYGLPVIGSLAAFGIVYAALCAYASKDMKMVIAYSSVSHLGFLVLGLFAFNREGLTGSVLHMVNHGLSTGALFAALGFLADRYQTTEMSKFGGLMGRFPIFAVITFVLCLASIGLPGLNNFVSEMLMMAGLFDARSPSGNRMWLAVVAAVGIFLSAWYTLTMMRRVFFNPLKEPEPVQSETPPARRDAARILRVRLARRAVPAPGPLPATDDRHHDARRACDFQHRRRRPRSCDWACRSCPTSRPARRRAPSRHPGGRERGGESRAGRQRAARAAKGGKGGTKGRREEESSPKAVSPASEE